MEKVGLVGRAGGQPGRRRGSTLRNQPRSGPQTLSPLSRRPGPTLAPTATRRSSRVVASVLRLAVPQPCSTGWPPWARKTWWAGRRGVCGQAQRDRRRPCARRLTEVGLAAWARVAVGAIQQASAVSPAQCARLWPPPAAR